MATVKWLGEDRFRIGRVGFRTALAGGFESTADDFLLAKPRSIVERYIGLMESLRPRRIVELGIYQGGSSAFLSLIAEPSRLVALDIEPEPSPALEDFIERNALGERLRTHYSADQADQGLLRTVLAEEFGDEALDLVVDDASHRLAPTRASFNVLFPHLRPGGVFVIEDWSGLHQYDAALSSQADGDPALRASLERRAESGDGADTPLSVLLFELILAAAYAPGLISEIGVSDGWAFAVRGPQEVEPAGFDLSVVYSESAGQLLGRTR